MADITTRAGKGAPLENDEVDANFTNLNDDKLEAGDDLGTPSGVVLTNATGLPTSGLLDNAVTDAKLRDSAALSVIGRASTGTGNPADIEAGANGSVLRRSGSSIGFGAIDLGSNQAVSGTLPVNQGGTGSTTAAGALTNFGLTATATELNYTDGVTSNIQTQLDSKAPLASPTFTGTVISNELKADNGNLILGDTAYSASAAYIGMKTSYQSGTSDYMIISGISDGDTYISAKDGSAVHIRGGGNYSTNEILVPDTGAPTIGGSTIWHAGNDGAGSGLDADLLDGQQGSYYTGYTDTAIANLVDSAPATLDTLNELAAALGDDPNFATTVTNSIAGKVSKSGDTMSSDLIINSIGANNNAAATNNIKVSGYGIVGNRGTFYVTNNGPVQIGVGGNHNTDSAMTFGTSSNVSQKTLYENSNRVFTDGYHPNADAWTTARTVSLTGAVTGSTSIDGSGNVSITTTATADPTLTLAGDASGSATFTNLGNATLTVTVADDSHNHTLANIDQVDINNTNDLDTYTTRGLYKWGGSNPANSPYPYGSMLVLPDGSQSQQLLQAYGGAANKVSLYGRRKTSGTWDTTWTQYFSDHYHPNADTLTTARTINGVSFNGSANITVADSTKLPLTGGTLTGGLTGTTGAFSTSIGIGAGVTLAESTDRADLLQITSSTSGYGGLQIRNSSNEGRWSFMTNGEVAGIYNDEDSQWHILMTEAAGVDLYYSASVKLATTSSGVNITGTATATTFSGPLSGNATTATALQTARNIAVTGAVTGNANFDGSGNISIATTATADPTLTLAGDASGSATFTNLGNATLTVTVADDSHNHTRLIAIDDRDMKPNTSGVGSTVKGIKAFFTSLGGMTGTANTDYQDVLVLDTYSDASGGNATALSFDKSNGAMRIWSANQTATTWGTSQRVFADNYHPNADTLTTARTINGVSFNGSANITVTANTPNTLTRGTYLTGSNFNGSAATTWAVDATTSATASKVVARDGNGYVFATYYNSAGTFSTTGSSTGMARFTGTNGTDTYGRSYTAAAARTLLNVADGATAYSANQALDTTSSPSFAGVNINGNLNAVDNIYLAGSLYHEGDTDTRVVLETNKITLQTGGSSEITVDATGVRLGDTGNGYFQPVSGSYGSVQIDGGAHGGYEGYSIGGRAVFMHNNATQMGLYDDVNNHWAVKHNFNAATELYFDGTSRLTTLANGVDINGAIYVDSYMYHSGDTNSYLGFSAADDFRIVVGGRQIIRCDEGTDPDKIQFYDANNFIDTSGNFQVSGAINKYTFVAPTTSATINTRGDNLTHSLPATSGNLALEQLEQNSQSAAYTTVLADAGKHILHPTADTTARTFTIASNASVAYPIGTAITFVNQVSAGVLTIAIATDTMRLAGEGTTGSRTLDPNGIATALKITSTEWLISGTGLS